MTIMKTIFSVECQSEQTLSLTMQMQRNTIKRQYEASKSTFRLDVLILTFCILLLNLLIAVS